MSLTIVQPGRREPAIDVRFQILKGKVPDGFSNTAEWRGPLGLQFRIRFCRLIQHLFTACGRLQWCCASSRRQLRRILAV
jgi:hypothetical protein